MKLFIWSFWSYYLFIYSPTFIYIFTDIFISECILQVLFVNKQSNLYYSYISVFACVIGCVCLCVYVCVCVCVCVCTHVFVLLVSVCMYVLSVAFVLTALFFANVLVKQGKSTVTIVIALRSMLNSRQICCCWYVLTT